MTSRSGQEPYRQRDLRIYLGVRLCSEIAALTQAVAIGWTIYQSSNSALALGFVGLAEFMPMALLMLPAGELCDRRDPRRILALGVTLQALCAGGFLALTWTSGARLWPFYLILALSGAARAFAEPAGQAVLPLLVPAARLASAVAWSSSVWQAAVIVGPALGGIAYSVGAAQAFALCAAAHVIALIAVAAMAGRPFAPTPGLDTSERRLARIRAGARFIRSQPPMMGAISLDLVSVLLGGATALLPIYARDILSSGPLGLGLLRSAPAAGAWLTALYQARHPPEHRVGRQLFLAVVVFGIGTMVFGVSRSLPLSLFALFVIGAADMVSVNIRSSMMLSATPDALRGRVSAVNMLFVCASSELGAFESGLLASMIGAVPCVVVGGVGVLLAAAVCDRAFPALRQLDRISSTMIE